jgi:hypothetical protein
LAYVDVAGTLFPVPVATVDAGTADQTVQPFLDCADGVHGFDKNPNLDHIARFTVVGRGFKAGGDDDSVAIFMENESVHATPPFIARRIARTADFREG